MTGACIINGELTDDGAVSIDDRGFTLGDGLFETIPLYNGRPYLLDRHLERLRAGAGLIGLMTPFDDREAAEGVETLARRNPADRQVARLTVTRGAGSRGYGVEGCGDPLWVLTVRPYSPFPERKYRAGFRLAPVSVRVNPHSPVSQVKSTSALERVVMMSEASRSGADEAFALSVDGHVASCAAANIFWVAGGRLCAPSQDCGILPGVTRRRVMEIAEDLGIGVEEGKFRPGALREADEVFLTNSLVEIMPVSEVSGLFEAKTPGPVTAGLAEEYRGAIR